MGCLKNCTPGKMAAALLSIQGVMMAGTEEIEWLGSDSQMQLQLSQVYLAALPVESAQIMRREFIVLVTDY